MGLNSFSVAAHHHTQYVALSIRPQIVVNKRWSYIECYLQSYLSAILIVINVSDKLSSCITKV